MEKFKNYLLSKFRTKKENEAEINDVWIVVTIINEYVPRASEKIKKRLEHEGQIVEYLE